MIVFKRIIVYLIFLSIFGLSHTTVMSQEPGHYSLVKHAYIWGYTMGYATGKWIKIEGKPFQPEIVWKNEGYQKVIISKWFLYSERSLENFKKGWFLGTDDGYHKRPKREIRATVNLSYIDARAVDKNNFVRSLVDGPFGREVFEYEVFPQTFTYLLAFSLNCQSVRFRLAALYGDINNIYAEMAQDNFDNYTFSQNYIDEIETNLQDNISYLRGTENSSIFISLIEELTDIAETINILLIAYSKGNYEKALSLSSEIESGLVKSRQTIVSVTNRIISLRQQWRLWVNSWDYVNEMGVECDEIEDIKDAVERLTSCASKDIENIVVPTEYFESHELLLRSMTLYKVSKTSFASGNTGMGLNALDGAIDNYEKARMDIMKMDDEYDIEKLILEAPKPTFTEKNKKDVLKVLNNETKKKILSMEDDSRERQLLIIIGQNIKNNSVIRTGIILGSLEYDENESKNILQRKEKQLGNLSSCEVLYCLVALFHDCLNQNGLATEYYNKSLELNPDDAETLYLYGVFLSKQYKLDEAIKILEKALRKCEMSTIGPQIGPLIRKKLSYARIDKGSYRARKDQEREEEQTAWRIYW